MKSGLWTNLVETTTDVNFKEIMCHHALEKHGIYFMNAQWAQTEPPSGVGITHDLKP